jgi:hypothetical protein
LADVEVIPRKPFVVQFGKDYQPGQHVTFLGPSGRGKTKLCGQLLIATTRRNKALQAVILHGKIKGRDQTIINLSKEGHFPIVSSWPPGFVRSRIRHRDRQGWTLRPLEKPGASVKAENDLLHDQFKGAIHKSYHASRKKPVILVVDETHQTHNDLKLKTDCEGPLMRGRPVCGVWSLVQRGRHVSYMVYDQAEYVFIFFDPDIDNQRRYAEIGGIDPMYVMELASQLKTHTVADGSTISQCLCFRRSGNQLSIVDT